MEQVREIAVDSMFKIISSRGKVDKIQLKTRVRDDISRFLYSKTKRRPMVLPVIMYV